MVLLDTSALLAHAREEPGWELVEEHLASGEAWVAAVTWLELSVALHRQAGGGLELLEVYRQGVAGTVNISAEVAESAFSLRLAALSRLPAMDSLIAGAAHSRGFHLIHRDAHLAKIPQEVLAHTRLPAVSGR
jgi:predicted nucleic acid-binding protein